MYHRIAPSATPGEIDVDQFRHQMRTIKRELNPVSLNELILGQEQNSVPDNAIVVTFDDGYSGFYDYALPVLKEEGIPCTLFVTTGFVNGDIWLWPDRLRYCVDNTSKDAIHFPGPDDLLILNADRKAAWNTLADHCLTLSNREKIAFMDSVEAELEVSPPGTPPTKYRALNWNQVREIASAGIEIGSHSVSHPVMTSLDDDSLRYELTQSKADIEQATGRKVASFCYPNGQPFDFDERVKTAVLSAGYKCALAAFPDRDTLGDPLAIHRYPGSLSSSMFEKTVFGLSYLGLARSVNN